MTGPAPFLTGWNSSLASNNLTRRNSNSSSSTQSYSPHQSTTPINELPNFPLFGSLSQTQPHPEPRPRSPAVATEKQPVFESNKRKATISPEAKRVDEISWKSIAENERLAVEHWKSIAEEWKTLATRSKDEIDDLKHDLCELKHKVTQLEERETELEEELKEYR